jgi:hypothetical protein
MEIYCNDCKSSTLCCVLHNINEDDTYEGLLQNLMNELYTFPMIIIESSQTYKLSVLFKNFILDFESPYTVEIYKVIEKHG